jgi:hypothetical protein
MLDFMKVTVEAFDRSRHENHMHEYPVHEPRHVVALSVGRYRLEFLSVEQIDAAAAYFKKPDGSTRLDARKGSHWEFQPWHCRLPVGITNKRHRSKLLEGLQSARIMAVSELRWNEGQLAVQRVGPASGGSAR